MESKKTHKPGIDTEKMIKHRMDGNAGLRKKKRDFKLALHRGIESVSDSAFVEKAPDFLILMKMDITKAIHMAMHNTYCQNPEDVLLGLNQIYWMFSHVDKDYNPCVAYDKIDAKVLCDRLCALLKTQDSSKEKHLILIANIIYEITYVKYNKNYAMKWNEVLWNSGIFATSFVHIKNTKCPWKIREPLLTSVNNFLHLSTSNIKKLAEHAAQCYRVLFYDAKDQKTFPKIAWYFSVILCSRCEFDWNMLIGTAFWNDFIPHCLAQDENQEMLYDAIVCLTQTVTRGTIFVDTCKKVTNARFVQLFERDDPKFRIAIIDIIYRISYEDESFCKKFCETYHEKLFAILRDNENPYDGVINSEQKQAKQVIIGLFHTYIACFKLEATVLLTKKNILFYIASSLCTIPDGDAKRQEYDLEIIGCAIGCFAGENVYFLNGDFFTIMFRSGDLVKAVSNQVTFPDPGRQEYVISVLTTILCWGKQVGYGDMVAAQIEESGHLSFISNLQYTTNSADLTEKIVQFEKTYDTVHREDYFEAVEMDMEEDKEVFDF